MLPQVFSMAVEVSTRKVDFDEIRGLETAKRRATVALAGNYNVQLIGPRGSGKTFLADAITSIKPLRCSEHRPCPCEFYGGRNSTCHCELRELKQYHNALRATPNVIRIVLPFDCDHILCEPMKYTTVDVLRVIDRHDNSRRFNSDPRRFDPDTQRAFKSMLHKYNVTSYRTAQFICSVAATIARMDGKSQLQLARIEDRSQIQLECLDEAFRCQQLDLGGDNAAHGS